MRADAFRKKSRQLFRRRLPKLVLLYRTNCSIIKADHGVGLVSIALLRTMPNPFAQKDVAAVDRALSILMALGNAQRALILSETAVATGLYKSTTLRHARIPAGRCR
jgi:hypothetical protein